MIDAILLEAIASYSKLKIWKEAKLQTEQLTGVVDYLIAAQGKVYQSPLLCVVEGNYSGQKERTRQKEDYLEID